ncbi:MAG: hypothetical protein QOF32_2414 [Gammaproteobacteria bacterium]|jgi:hypothetical protein|nr:hypothetical protein [Gammaproteobacteria bacterium]
MDTEAPVPQRVPVELLGEPSNAAMPNGMPVNGADAARSKKNILQWTAYLPEDCIKTMIEMGWDVTT